MRKYLFILLSIHSIINFQKNYLMAYKPVQADIIKDISKRKEFYTLKLPTAATPTDFAPKYVLSEHLKNSNFLELHSYQLFVKHFINPNTPYARLLMKWETGVGKTIGAISIAMTFIKTFRQNALISTEELGSVFIIGFTKNIFKSELLRYPNLGFITVDELYTLKQLNKAANRGLKADILNLQDFMVRIKRRLSNRKGNGYFKFYGYKEFANKLFMLQDADLSEQNILQKIKSGNINTALLKSFKNSLIICDEIHNTYNSAEKNNWGLAIQYVLDNIPSARAVLLSATPINNSATEIVDLLNLLVPATVIRREVKNSSHKLTKSDLFSNINDQTLDPAALKLIKKLTAGRISFIRDTNPLFFPTKKYIGEPIPGIDYLKFISAEMSPFQYATYASVDTETLAHKDIYIVDFAIPNPKYGIPKFDKNGNPDYGAGEIGMYQLKKISHNLRSAPKEWTDRMGLQWHNNMIIGPALKMSRLKYLSTKFYKMIGDIHTLIKKKAGKIFIYHNSVHVSGILFIQEILKQNGLIPYNGISTQNTLCTIDGLTLAEHAKITDHKFNPAQFIIVHSGINKHQINREMQIFNNPDNAAGKNILIIVGSRIIKESYDLKAIRNVYIMSRPDNIPMLLQIIGRAVRKNSHINLPENERNVDISIYISTLPKNSGGGTMLGYEARKYKEKIKVYKIIQQIEKTLNESAVDLAINNDLIFQKNKLGDDPLAPLNFQPEYLLPENVKINSATYDIYYAESEVNFIITLIKRIYIELDIAWTYKQLWEKVKCPPAEWHININTKILSENNFLIALTRILWSESAKYTEPIIKVRDPIKIQYRENNYINTIYSMMDPYNKIIMLPNKRAHIIAAVGEYYTLFPFSMQLMRPVIDINAPYQNTKDNDAAYINIKEYIASITPDQKYESRRAKFIEKYMNYKICDMIDAVCNFDIDFHQLFAEEIIVYIFNIQTDGGPINPDYNDFYIKVLYYYDILGMIIWANTVREIYEEYADFNNKTTTENELLAARDTAGNNWIPSYIQKKFEKKICATIKKIKKKEKLLAGELPVGHHISDISRLYNPKVRCWQSSSKYKKSAPNWIENDIVVGFDEKPADSLYINFKIRSPIQNIKKYSDFRKIETGVACTSKKKHTLMELAAQLGVLLPRKINTIPLCNLIRQKLICNELKERSTPGSKIKWFYMYYEQKNTYLNKK